MQLAAGEALAIVGESGCGKSVTARSLLRLLPEPPARVRAERLSVAGVSVLDADARGLRALRGRSVGFVFQDPMSALNPAMTIGAQIVERLRRHRGMDRRAAKQEAASLLSQVGIPDAEGRLKAWPHQLSGGQRQRVVIAIALAADPALLIADEPTTALDVTVQAQILTLLDELRRARGMAVLLITHDLGVVAQGVDRVAVMYAGQVVEQGAVADLFAAPRHPYTAGLLQAVPGSRPGELYAIPGRVPAPRDFPAHCRFADRCDRAQSPCRAEQIELSDTGVRCLYPLQEAR
ncbi:MAG: ABC transporter ATP-binding protein [Bradymonadia bacterium]